MIMDAPEIFVLLMLYWGYNRSSMISQEFNSRATCEAAIQTARQAMDSSFSLTNGIYAVCVRK
jgi:hypothetical protein